MSFLVLARHGFHVVQLRPWPLVGSVRAFRIAVGLISWFHTGGYLLLVIGLLLLLLVMLGW